MKQNFAKIISTLCHPLLTIPLYIAFVMFAFEDIKKASYISSLIIGGVFVPLVLWMFFKSRNGSYTNFDVSDRKQRKSLFVFIIPILIIVTIILYKTQQSGTLLISFLFALILVSVSQVVNLKVKSSLHVSLNIFLSFLIMPMNYTIGLIVLSMTILIGWSRVVLGRHTVKEVLTGGGIGLAISLIMYYTEMKF